MSLDAATLALVAGELKTTLLDAKIDKIFEPTRDEVLMTLRTRTETHRLLLSARSGSARVCLTKESFENPLTPPGFCMLLRKHLTGGRLIELRREPGDRIVYFDFRCTNEMGDLVTNTLAVELMGRYSNLVLVQDGRIIDALKRVDLTTARSASCCPAWPTRCRPSPRGRTSSRQALRLLWRPPARRICRWPRRWAKRWRALARSSCGRLSAAHWAKHRR